MRAYLHFITGMLIPLRNGNLNPEPKALYKPLNPQWLQEWKPQEPVAVHLSLKGGKRYKMWQMVSYYSVTAKSMSGARLSSPLLACLQEHVTRAR